LFLQGCEVLRVGRSPLAMTLAKLIDDCPLEHLIGRAVLHDLKIASTKGAAIDYGSQDAPDPAPDRSGQEGESSAENLLRQAKEAVGSVAGAASEAARGAYEQSRRYTHAARRRYPEAERYYQEGLGTVRDQTSENPLLTLLVGFDLGTLSPG
jgi:hypothetical protein